jgi:hypothetical protein
MQKMRSNCRTTISAENGRDDVRWREGRGCKQWLQFSLIPRLEMAAKFRAKGT